MLHIAQSSTIQSCTVRRRLGVFVFTKVSLLLTAARCHTLSALVADSAVFKASGDGGFLHSCFSFSCLFNQVITVSELQTRTRVSQMCCFFFFHFSRYCFLTTQENKVNKYITFFEPATYISSGKTYKKYM